MSSTKPVLLGIGLYFFIRLFSFYSLPFPIAQTFITIFLILAFVVISIKNPFAAWVILIAEFLLDGNGHFFELFGLALRTWFVYAFLMVWLIHTLRQHKLTEVIKLPKPLLIILAALDTAFCIGLINGVFHEHPIRNILQDFIPYTFLLLIFPAKQYLNKFLSRPIAQSILTAYLIGSACFSIFTLALFSTGTAVLHGPYYKWFRDVAGGKITDVGNHFFRIVLPEHLLLVPILLILFFFIVNDRKQRRAWLLVGIGFIPLAMSVSRTYVIALVIGMLCLYSKKYWRQLANTTCIATITFIAIFSTIHFIASRGASFGWELYGARFAGVVQPSHEVSSASRKALLTPIFEKIKDHPIIGSGLGERLTFIDPETQQPITTSQFDWGYLEIWTELGLIGLMATVSLIAYLFREAKLSAINHRPRAGSRTLRDYPLSAPLVAFAFMQITTQAIFHVFGILFLIFAINQVWETTLKENQQTPLIV